MSTNEAQGQVDDGISVSETVTKVIEVKAADESISIITHGDGKHVFEAAGEVLTLEDAHLPVVVKYLQRVGLVRSPRKAVDPLKPKRKRRTKAEIDAAKAGKGDEYEGTTAAA